MSNDKKKESNLFEEIKKLDEKKEKLCKSIAEINAFSIELKDKLEEEDIDLQTKTYQILIEKEKLKNENQINILAEDNEKLEKYLTLLAKQYELEIKYIEQYCEHKSKIEKISEKYAHVNFNEIVPIRDLFSKQLNDATVLNSPAKQTEKPPDEQVAKPPIKQVETEPPVKQIDPVQRRNTISAIVKEPNINKNDIRQDGSLQDHLKQALNDRFKTSRD